jgi:ribonuclease HII
MKAPLVEGLFFMFDLNYFKKITFSENIFIAGVDEVGRGPLAGPVVSACVLIVQKSKNILELKELLVTLMEIGVTDSKKLKSIERKKILTFFSIQLINNQKFEIKLSKNMTLKYCIQEISVEEIDEINILNAALKSMKFAFELVCSGKGLLLIDGNKKINTSCDVELETIIKGDMKSLVIGLASIIAKEYRDQLMEMYSHKYPGYFWETNAGYGTKKHLKAINELGITPIHRKTFKGVKEFYENGRTF